LEIVTAAAPHAPATSTYLLVDEQSQIGAARRSAVALGHLHGLGEDSVARLAIVVTEAATNIVRHAGRGVIILRPLLYGPVAGIEMLAIDKGPGIANVERAMRNGFSTGGTSGQGLGSIQRMADQFAVHSERDRGTVILARLHATVGLRAGTVVSRTPTLDDRLGAICVPMHGQTGCGDDWMIIVDRRRLSVMLVDGLGHGVGAAEAAAAATSTFSRLGPIAPPAALVTLHTALRGTRGAALSIATIDEAARTVAFSGVGNVDGRVLGDGGAEHLSAQNGIVGHTMPTPRGTAASWPGEARLVMHSDGISSRWRIDAYPGLLTAHPALLAGVIYRDFSRERDDATILVLATTPVARAA
jgi:anti-sigma regulatory factor (Ser/Thr protein kinase)